MDKEAEIDLNVRIARIEERQIGELNERNNYHNELTSAIQLVSVQINKMNSEREADNITLKMSLEKSLCKFRDEDVVPMQTQLKNLTLWSFLQKHYGYLILFCAIILITFSEKIYGIIETKAKKEGIDLIEPDKDTACNNKNWITKLIE